MKVISFRHLRQIETICPSFDAVSEFWIKAHVLQNEEVEIKYIRARVYSIHQNLPAWEDVPIPTGNMSEDQKKMMATFREMARNEAYKQSKQNAKDVH